MRRVRILYGAAVFATAILFFVTARRMIFGLFAAELVLELALYLLLRLDVGRLKLSVTSRFACVAGQQLAVRIQAKYPFMTAAGIVQGILEYDNQLLSCKTRIPVELVLERRQLLLSMEYEPEGCGAMGMCLKDLWCYDIFGLNRMRIPDGRVQPLTVYPGRFPIRLAHSVSRAVSGEGEQQNVEKKGRDASEVYDLREYQPGDDVRSIHWKLSGKLDTMIVREASDTSRYDILVFLDAGLKRREKSCSAAALTAAVSAATSISEKLLRLGMPHYTAVAAGGRIFFSRVTERSEYMRMLDTWMNLHLEEQQGSGLALLLAERQYKNYRRIFYITADGYPEQTHSLSSGVSVTAISILDEEGDARVTKNGESMLMELPLGQLAKNLYTVDV